MKYLNLKELENVDVSIDSNSKWYDLHNIADFKTLIFNKSKRELILVWIHPGEYFLNNMAKDYNEKALILRYL